jgi:hypothetical protein
VSRIDDLDDVAKVITSSSWRFMCLGANKNDPRKPGGSNSDWARFRQVAGLIGGNFKATEQRDLTRRQAFLLLVLGRLTIICDQIGMKKPRRKDLDTILLLQIAEEWAETIGEPMEDAFRILASVNGGIPGAQLEIAIREWAGKPLSQRTIRRKCASARIRFSRKKIYSPCQVQKIYKVVNES